MKSESSAARAAWSMRRLVGFAVLATILLTVCSVPADLLAQEAPTATRLEMRHFWHVFIAYALAWIILFGWLVSIGRRFRRIEERLN